MCFFDMGEKVGFTNCVFVHLCSSENIIFILFSAKHSTSNSKMYLEKKTKMYEKLWVVFEHGKKVFFVFSWF